MKLPVVVFSVCLFIAVVTFAYSGRAQVSYANRIYGETDLIARDRIQALDRRIDRNEDTIREIIRGQQAIQSKMDQFLGGLGILAVLTAGQFVVSLKRDRKRPTGPSD